MASGLRSGSVEFGRSILFGFDLPTTSMSGMSRAGTRCGAASEKMDHFKIDSIDISEARSSTSADGGASSEGTETGLPCLFWTISLIAGDLQLTDPVSELSFGLEVAK